jgi:hypothetical protein
MPEVKWTPEMRRDAKIAALLRSLISSPGWEEFKRQINERAKEQHNLMLQPATDIMSVYRTEYAKGAVYGLTLALALPEAIIEGVTESLPKEPEKEE